ncbi:MAG: DUF5647 family protein [Planctomycetaceae bacterium]
MIDPDEFARRQMELTAEFAKYVLENPEIDARLPEDSYIYFEIDGEKEFNDYSRQLAERRERDDGTAAVCVRVKGLAAPQGSRLIDPQIVASRNAV